MLNVRSFFYDRQMSVRALHYTFTLCSTLGSLLRSQWSLQKILHEVFLKFLCT